MPRLRVPYVGWGQRNYYLLYLIYNNIKSLTADRPPFILVLENVVTKYKQYCTEKCCTGNVVREILYRNMLHRNMLYRKILYTNMSYRRYCTGKCCTANIVHETLYKRYYTDTFCTGNIIQEHFGHKIMYSET